MSYYLDKILESVKITDFLAEKGIHPTKTVGDKFVYKCPVHSGDNDPSFVVYKEGKAYQNYFCYGCKSGVSLINLYSDLHGVTIKESVRHFMDKMNFDEIEARDEIIRNAKDRAPGNDEGYSIEQLLLVINSRCRECLHDQVEIDFFEKVFILVDSIARKKDIVSLKKIYDFLIEKGFPRRYKIFKEREYKERMSEVALFKEM